MDQACRCGTFFPKSRLTCLPWCSRAATMKELWSPDVEGGHYRDEMAVATYAVQVASTVARELQAELCKQGAIRYSPSFYFRE